MSLDPALRARIESVLSANPVVLFLKGTPEAPQCGFSAKTAAAMDATGATYAHVNVLADPDIRDGRSALRFACRSGNMLLTRGDSPCQRCVMLLIGRNRGVRQRLVTWSRDDIGGDLRDSSGSDW